MAKVVKKGGRENLLNIGSLNDLIGILREVKSLAKWCNASR